VTSKKTSDACGLIVAGRGDGADLLFGRVLFAGCAADVFDMLFRTALWPGFLAHLRSIMATMIQKSSVREISQ